MKSCLKKTMQHATDKMLLGPKYEEFVPWSINLINKLKELFCALNKSTPSKRSKRKELPFWRSPFLGQTKKGKRHICCCWPFPPLVSRCKTVLPTISNQHTRTLTQIHPLIATFCQVINLKDLKRKIPYVHFKMECLFF